jgi:hypothetical protein
MKVKSLATGGLTDVWMNFSESRSKASREKLADAISDTETSLSPKRKKAKQEDS